MTKTPLLLIPGLLCSPRLYGPQLAALGDVAEIVVPDWRKAPLSVFDAWDKTARWVLDQMPSSEFALAGLSLGGMIAVEIMQIAAERVTRLALLDTGMRSQNATEHAVVCGRDDVATPLAFSEEIAAGIEGSELIVIEQCGHLITMERPEETNAILRKWLS